MSDRKKVHEGRNIKRFREMLGIKQDALAWELGEDWNQQKVSLLEQKEAVDEAILRQVCQILKIPVEAIKNFDEENAVNIIANSVTTVNDNATGQVFHVNSTINTTEKWLSALDEIKQLHSKLLKEKDDKITLYERMLKEKDEMMEMLKGLVESLKA